MKRKVFLGIFIIAWITIVCCAFLLLSTNNQDIHQQEQLNEVTANEYLVQITQEHETESETNTIPSDLDYEDNELYQDFSEDNAWGYVDSVLEIPKINLRQSVYSGRPYQIEHDLRNWMAVTARADYILGETHYCIYIHNPSDGSIKISRAQTELDPGDYLLVTQKEHVYLYKVTNIFPEWRYKCTTKYVDNMATDNTLLYIFTCGIDEWQGRNMVIEAEVDSVYTVSDWNKNKDQYINDYKERVGIIEKKEEKSALIMDLEFDKELKISLTTPNYTKAFGCSIAVCDKDGQLVEGFQNPIEYNDIITIPQLADGEYYIGVYDNESGYSNPDPFKVTVNNTESTKEISTVTKVVEQNKQRENIIKYAAISMVGAMSIMSFVMFFRQISVKKNKKNISPDNSDTSI